ncbi:hypothetical protein T265_08148 [Opisthorchis viverrini]|uniref:Uncharacterized protein n=1 Tax=Opisthorchis viverrini TaxID=6198 RepID=A0A074ZL73_OPIVI|nr:hypothetical protein T265_08148 [Opisthorchis viverrini]KER24105.1 hypothetical protein T265_08148 [Opisthorchis viverrini]
MHARMSKLTFTSEVVVGYVDFTLTSFLFVQSSSCSGESTLEHWTRVLVQDECVTPTPLGHVGYIWIFMSEQSNGFMPDCSNGSGGAHRLARVLGLPMVALETSVTVDTSIGDTDSNLVPIVGRVDRSKAVVGVVTMAFTSGILTELPTELFFSSVVKEPDGMFEVGKTVSELSVDTLVESELAAKVLVKFPTPMDSIVGEGCIVCVCSVMNVVASLLCDVFVVILSVGQVETSTNPTVDRAGQDIFVTLITLRRPSDEEFERGTKRCGTMTEGVVVVAFGCDFETLVFTVAASGVGALCGCGRDVSARPVACGGTTAFAPGLTAERDAIVVGLTVAWTVRRFVSVEGGWTTSRTGP